MRRIRLFRIFDATGKMSFDKLLRLVSSKLRHSSSYSLAPQEIRLSYLDVDHDCVIVDSAEDLVDAIDQFSDQRVLRLFVGEATPAMRQAYLRVSAGGDPKRCNSISDMERQIEEILEKRFRLLEQQRRNSNNNSSNNKAAVAAAKEGNASPFPRMQFSPQQHTTSPYGHPGWNPNHDRREDLLPIENQRWLWDISDRHMSQPSPKNLSINTEVQILKDDNVLRHGTPNSNSLRNRTTPRRPPGTVQSRDVIDSKADMDAFRAMMSSVRHPGSPGAIHRKIQDDYVEDNNDFDDQEQYESADQQWDDESTGTVDSDAELSILLSDTDFRDIDNRDDDLSPTKHNTAIQEQTFHNEERDEPELKTGTRGLVSRPAEAMPPPFKSSHGTNKPSSTPSPIVKTVTESKFNNIPRPTPPKKNKLIGMLYKGD